MSISSLAGNFSANAVANQGSALSAGRRSDRDGDGGGVDRRVGGPGGPGGAFAQAVGQALSQSGLSGAVQQPGGQISGTKDAGSNREGREQNSGAAPDAGQALNAFMHTLFQTMQSAGAPQDATGSAPAADPTAPESAAAAATTPPRSGYSNPASDLENVLQQLGASSGARDSGGGSGVSELKSAFDNLVNALGADGTDGTSSQGSAPDLRAFLQNLQKDLPSEGGSRLPPPTGSVFRASA